MDELIKALRCVAQNESEAYQECNKHEDCDDCPFTWEIDGAEDAGNVDVIATLAADALEAAQKRIAELETLNHHLEIVIDEQGCDLAKLREAQRWIPCSERLPARYEPVLIYSQLWIRPVLALVRDDEFWTGKEAVTPTHWMPLPEPPKGE